MKREDFNTLPPPVAAFLRYHDNLSHSKLTTANYANDLRLYFRYLAERHGLIPADLPPDAWEDIDLSAIGDSFLKGITLEETADFLAHCFYERDNNPRTRARKVVTIRRFFHYLTVNRHLLENNPMEELVSPKIGKTLPKYLSVEECRTLLGAVEGSFPERDSCILILFLNCGLRLSELCALNLRDIRHDEHILQIRGKGNKERTVHLNGACMAAIRRYLRVRPQDRVAQEDRDALFISRNNRRINQRSVQLMLEKLLEKTGL
ncbi:MAG: tyrosine-type recombinase/integrase, partial [Oscillospiraceae bacterium]|nr:tyrosine-type recombinase/integrase [Oscillospiraceae bacterium]